jgi:succinate dehydrogenase / fumarate reductase, flavoprotein subunit
VDEAHYLQAAKTKIQTLLDQPGEYRINAVRQAFQDCMTEYCGVFRTADRMQKGLAELQEIKQKAERIYLDDKNACWNTELTEAIELRSLLTVGEVILTSALNRKESRGSHYREDYQDRDDVQFLQHTLAYHNADGVKIEGMPVVINQFQPQERKY